MITRLRLAFVVLRPPVVLLVLLYLALGATAAGAGVPGLVPLIAPAVAVLAVLQFGLALNDLSDEAIDRVNLAGDPTRTLLTGRRTRRALGSHAAAWAGSALLIGFLLGWRSALVVAVSLLIGAAYSLPPLRLASRGVVAALVLPACFVAMPYLLGALAMVDTFRPADPRLLAGLYVAFVGRILLKDFRDVRGDALFGKRTFLVRHGRVATCTTSAVFWGLGSGLVLMSLPAPSSALIAAMGSAVAGGWILLWLLASAPGHRREEWLISALAVVGRGMALAVLADLSAVAAGWDPQIVGLTVGAIGVVSAGQAVQVARHGPSPTPWERDPRSWGLALDASEPTAPGGRTTTGQ